MSPEPTKRYRLIEPLAARPSIISGRLSCLTHSRVARHIEDVIHHSRPYDDSRRSPTCVFIANFQSVSQLHLLRPQVACVCVCNRRDKRTTFDSNTAGYQGIDLRKVVCEQLNFRYIQIGQHRGSRPITTRVHCQSEAFVCLYCIDAFPLLQFHRCDLGRKTSTTPFLIQV
jgi:hypothetical protein